MKNIEKISFRSLKKEAVRLNDVYVRIDATPEYKKAADELLLSLGFKNNGTTRHVPFISNDVYIYYSR